MDIEKANAKATEQMMEARPVLVGLGKALDVIPGMRENLLLHAGPPITWERASGPMRGAITGALIFEGIGTFAISKNYPLCIARHRSILPPLQLTKRGQMPSFWLRQLRPGPLPTESCPA